MSRLMANYLLEPSEPRSVLSHLPGEDGLPFVGSSFEFLADPLAYARRVHAAYGPVSRSSFLFERRVNLMSAEGNELVLQDRGQMFSALRGWQPVLGQLFPRGLMLRDGDDHRYHRRLMQPAFRKEALAAYLDRMAPRIARTVAQWRERGSFLFYPAVKRLTLEIAAEVFMGVELEAEVDRFSHDFHDVVQASTAVNRMPVIGRLYRRGIQARARLVSFLASRIAQRRSGQGSDLFSQLCRAEDENGSRYSDAEVIDHLIFLMMAAHDTTTSALTSIVYALARETPWQDRLRGAVQANGRPAPQYEDLAGLELIDWVLREALRLYPPLTIILRRSLKPFEIHGLHIPANVCINLFPVMSHRLPQWWTDPDRFDPERFSPARAEHRRHPFAWAPFGGGAHMCLGLHFAEMQVKAVLQPLLLNARLVVPAGYQMPYQMAPIVRPRDGLPITLAAP